MLHALRADTIKNTRSRRCRVTNWSAVGHKKPSFLVVAMPVHYRLMHYRAKRALAIACRPSVRLSATLVDSDHIGLKSWKLTARTISPTPSLFLAQRPGEHGEILGRLAVLNLTLVRLYEETWEALIYGAHRAVIFAIAQLSRFRILAVRISASSALMLRWRMIC